MHILVVDDEELALAELTHELKIVFPNAALHGYRNPKEAIEYAAALSAEGEVFSYAFLDIKMRGMSGLELARQLKIIFPKVNLFFCTAYSEYAIDAFGMFAKGYLKKPVAASEIKRVLDEMVTDWSLKRLRSHVISEFRPSEILKYLQTASRLFLKEKNPRNFWHILWTGTVQRLQRNKLPLCCGRIYRMTVN